MQVYKNLKILGAHLFLSSMLVLCDGLVYGQTTFPRITQVSPSLGEPGTVVLIHGTGFTGIQSVLFGVGVASFEFKSDSLIQAVVPEDATTSAITISTNRGFAASHIAFQVAPRIERFEPQFGKSGDTILLTGANFSGLSSLQIGSHPATFNVVGDTQLSFTIPTGAVSGLIRLVSPAGWADSESSFEVIGPEPYITSFEPELAAPGTLVAIRGVQFSNATEVVFGEDRPGEFSVVADTQILVRIPSGAISGPVAVTTSQGTGISRIDFLVIGTGPFISELDPDHGQQGDTIVVSGVNLSDVQQILVNEVEASFDVVADTQLSFVIPTDATSGPIHIRTENDEFVFESGLTVDGPGPVLESFSPLSGLPGETVKLIGTHFSHVESVRFGETEAAFVVTAETQMTADVPEGAETAPITIVTAFGETKSDLDFMVRDPAPELTGFEPAFGPIGTPITLRGHFFNSVTNVVVGGKFAEYEIVADTQILTQVPPEAITGTIELQSKSGTTVSAETFYLPATIQAILPKAAVPGAQVEIQGENLTGSSRIRFGGVNADIVATETESLVVEVPSSALIGPVTVTTPAGSIATTFDFEVLPMVESITPTAGPIGSILQIKGRGFTEVVDVVIGLVSAAFEIKSPELVELNVPFNATSGSIIVRNPVGQSVSTDQFQIRTSAELSLEVSLSDATSSWQTPSRFIIKVHNAGPSPARNFFVRHQMPEGVRRLGGSNNGGSTDVLGELVVDSVVNLNAGETVEIQHVVSTPFYGVETHHFSIDASIFDPTVEDQQRTIRRHIIGPPLRLTAMLQSDGSVRLRWPAPLRGYQLQMNASPDQSDAWMSYEGQPVVTPDWQQVSIEHQELLPNQFFRLQSSE